MASKQENKLMIFQASPTERTIVREIDGKKIRIVSGRVNLTHVQKFMGKDFEYYENDIVDWYGQDYKVIDVGERVYVISQCIILCQVTLSRLIEDSDNDSITPEQQKSWEIKVKEISDKKRAQDDKVYRLQQKKKQRLKAARIARAKLKKEQIEFEKKAYAEKCSTSIRGLEL